MAIRIGDVWDSTTDALAGGAGVLAPVAGLAFFVPAALSAAVESFGGKSAAAAGLNALVAVIALVAALWGQLTVIGVATDPAATRGGAARGALARLGPALGVTLVLLAVVVVAALPIGIALAAGGLDLRAAMAGSGAAHAPEIAPGALLFCVGYGLLLIVVGLWVSARLFVWAAVVLRERRGIGAIGRSFALTRGLAPKLIAVALLLVVVYAVAALAAQFVVFLVFRLILGPAQIATATWAGALAGAAVSAVFSTVVAAFSGRLYAALAPAATPIASTLNTHAPGPWG